MSEQVACAPVEFTGAREEPTAKEHFESAFTAHKAGDFKQAAAHYEQTIQKEPGHFEALNNLGVIRIQTGRNDEAMILFQSTLDVKPSYALAHSNMASVLTGMKRRKEALWHAFKAHSAAPDHLSALNNMAEALIQLGRFDDARLVAQYVLNFSPDVPEALNNLGVALWGLDNPRDARDLFTRVATLQPGTHTAARATNNLGVIALAAFDFAQGWECYRARFDADRLQRRFTKHQDWDGEAHAHGKLIVVAEQGLGDEILYLSMAAEAAARFKGPVVWECDTRLLRLVPNNIKNLEFVPRSLAIPQTYPGASHRVEAGTLGKFLRPAVENFPFQLPAAKWLKPTNYALSFSAPVRRVGISWRSVNNNNGANKSIPFAEWSSFIGALYEDSEIVNLQYGDTPDADADPRVTKLPFDCRFDIEALANEISKCDLIVTVSNTTAHLAGALGTPTIVLLADGMGRYWYWGNSAKTVWYPTASIVRQNGRAWPDVLHDTLVHVPKAPEEG